MRSQGRSLGLLWLGLRGFRGLGPAACGLGGPAGWGTVLAERLGGASCAAGYLAGRQVPGHGWGWGSVALLPGHGPSVWVLEGCSGPSRAAGSRLGGHPHSVGGPGEACPHGPEWSLQGEDRSENAPWDLVTAVVAMAGWGLKRGSSRVAPGWRGTGNVVWGPLRSSPAGMGQAVSGKGLCGTQAPTPAEPRGRDDSSWWPPVCPEIQLRQD